MRSFDAIIIGAGQLSRYLAQMGWDWIILDLQHFPMNWETAYECIHTIRAAGARPLVRTAIGAPAEGEKALDLGAGGVVGAVAVKSAVPDGAYASVDSVVGQTTKVFMGSREPVTATKLSSRGGGLSMLVRPKMRAASIEVNSVPRNVSTGTSALRSTMRRNVRAEKPQARACRR